MVSPDLRPIVLAGPTGAGKSALAIEMALELDGEIICADSRQLYKNMKIGTACPSNTDYARVPHHGFERLEPNMFYSAGLFIQDADAYCQDIQSRGKKPILVGGTGLYLRAFRFGLDDVLPSDPNVRQSLEALSLAELYEQLQSKDVGSAERIGPEDGVRLLRALEIFTLTGQKPSLLRTNNWSKKPRVEAQWLLKTCETAILDQRLHERAVKMFESGLVEEALALGQHISTPGYPEALAYASGELSLDEAVEKVFRAHRQYAKRQMTWFKKESWWTWI